MGGPQISRQSSPAVVAHRGASATYPENTLEAFEGAVAAGADVVELDVRLTADGVPVILHDLDVGNRTEGSGFVHTLTLAQVKRLDGPRGRRPPPETPTLGEAREDPAGRGGVSHEDKHPPRQPTVRRP